MNALTYDTTDSVLSALLKAQLLYTDDERMNWLGKIMFTMYTDKGFPPDMFLDELAKWQELDLLAKIYIVSVYQTLFLEHRRKSGIQDKSLEKIRKRNVADLDRLIRTGELGIY